MLVLFLVAWTGAFLWLSPDMPDTETLVAQSRQPRVTLIAADGSIVAERGVEGRAYVKLDQISPLIEAAVIATEDRRFYSHFGLDLIGTARAMLSNLSAGGIVAGGSTITQQLAKNLYLTPERSIVRKLKELMLAVWLEARLSKPEILEVYLNRVYLGAGAYGVEQASQRYFGKSAADVSLAQAAMLAGLLKAPSRYAPTRDLPTAQARAATVARLMADMGFVSPEDAQAVASDPAGIEHRRNVGRAEDFTAFVLSSVFDDLGKPEQALVVKTSLDRSLQATIERVLDTRLGPHSGVQAAVVALDIEGKIRAMMGSRNRLGDHRNRVTDLARQPGSAFKSFVYLTALEQGFRPQDLVTDEPFEVEGWSPKNAGGQFFGRISLEEAFARSINTVAVKLSETVGRHETMATAKRLGIHTALKPVASLPLGTVEVTPLEMAEAYHTITAGGRRLPSSAVERISDQAGRVLYELRPTAAAVVEPQVAALMRDMMRLAVTNGSGRRAAVSGMDIGGKTGTTQGNRDAWFVGFAGTHTIAVWLGRDDQKPMAGISGSNLPAEIFADIAKTLPKIPIVQAPRAKPTSEPTPCGQREDGLKRMMDWFDRLMN